MDSATVRILAALLGAFLLLWALRELWPRKQKPPASTPLPTDAGPSEWYIQTMAEIEHERQANEDEQQRAAEKQTSAAEAEERKALEQHRSNQAKPGMEETSVQAIAKGLAKDLLSTVPRSRKKS
jgi:hypothetical protein